MNELEIIENIDINLESKLLQLPQIEYNKKGLEKLVNLIKKKYENIVFNEEDVRSAKADKSKINNTIKALSRYRIDTVNMAKKPLEEFESAYKQAESELKVILNNIENQIKIFEEKWEKETIKKLEELRVEVFSTISNQKELIEYIALPELKGDFSKSKFNIEKAREFLLEQINQVMNNYKMLSILCDDFNKGHNINLDVKNYIMYINDTYTATRLIDEDKKRILEFRKQEEERAKQIVEEANKKIEEKRQEINQKMEEIEKQNTNTLPKIDKKEFAVQLLIKLKKEEIEKAKKLKEFLDSEEITYQRL